MKNTSEQNYLFIKLYMAYIVMFVLSWAWTKQKLNQNTCKFNLTNYCWYLETVFSLLQYTLKKAVTEITEKLIETYVILRYYNKIITIQCVSSRFSDNNINLKYYKINNIKVFKFFLFLFNRSKYKEKISSTTNQICTFNY